MTSKKKFFEIEIFFWSLIQEVFRLQHNDAEFFNFRSDNFSRINYTKPHQPVNLKIIYISNYVANFHAFLLQNLNFSSSLNGNLWYNR